MSNTAVVTLITVIIVPFFAYLLREKIFETIGRIWRWLTTSRRNAKKLKRALDAVNSQDGLWLAIPLKNGARINTAAPNGYDVTTVANLKGGVGKTTLAANLIGHCAKHRAAPNKSILGIDFDYQGSLTSMALPDDNQNTTGGEDTSAGKLLIKGLDHTKEIPHAIEPIAKFIASNYPFAQVENRLMVKWLLGEFDDDLRLRLTNQFTDLFQGDSLFNKIIIDAPPRLTTGAIQSLCASSHIIIPTVMDLLSTEAVGQFVTQIDDLRRNNFCPYLKKITVVGTIVKLSSPDEQREHEILCEAMKQGRCTDIINVVPFELSVLDKPELMRHAGHRIAYLDPHDTQQLREIRRIFDNLGDHIWG